MTQIKSLLDEYGVIHRAVKILPQDLKIYFLEALAELEDNECHRKKEFPKTRLHRVTGIEEAIYRADIEKVSGWRIHVQYEDKKICIKDIIEGQKHDQVIKVIKSKKYRYTK